MFSSLRPGLHLDKESEGFWRNLENCKDFHFLSLFGRSRYGLYDKVYKGFAKMDISIFSVSVPAPIWTRNYQVSGGILKTVKFFTFYHFLDVPDMDYTTRFIKGLRKLIFSCFRYPSRPPFGQGIIRFLEESSMEP